EADERLAEADPDQREPATGRLEAGRGYVVRLRSARFARPGQRETGDSAAASCAADFANRSLDAVNLCSQPTLVVIYSREDSSRRGECGVLHRARCQDPARTARSDRALPADACLAESRPGKARARA